MDSVVSYLKASNLKPINYSDQDKIINTGQLNNVSQLAKNFIIIPYFNNINYKKTNDLNYKKEVVIYWYIN
ncbi:hypothetical protein [Chryseobacterium joostei]|uniref:hypothetical protein n=1 Tax=Chryseobacterium joostei TaxID=112234 RepID=UPI003D11B321